MILSACIDSIFRGADPSIALKTLACLGIKTYEFWDWRSKDLKALEALHSEYGMTPAACCTSYFDMVNPNNRHLYISALKDSIEAAQSIGIKMLITQTGNDTSAPRCEQLSSMIDCLAEAAPLLESSGITLLVEPLNERDHSGHFLTTTDDALTVMRAVDHPNVRMLFDIYHQQITEGDLLRNLERALPYVAHVHAASNPGRHELNYGELHYKNIFEWLNGAHYSGYIGLEYFPVDPPEIGIQAALDIA